VKNPSVGKTGCTNGNQVFQTKPRGAPNWTPGRRIKPGTLKIRREEIRVR